MNGACARLQMEEHEPSGCVASCCQQNNASMLSYNIDTVASYYYCSSCIIDLRERRFWIGWSNLERKGEN